LAEVDNRSAENETATTTVASNPADSPSTTANEEAEWAELRARLARLRGDPELTMELERSEVEVASSRVMEDRPSLAQATDEEAQETQLTAELCAIPCQAVLDVSLAQGTPRGQTPSKVTGTKLRDEGRDDETQASGGGRTRLNPHAVEFVPSHRFAIDVELGQPHSEHSPPADASGRPRVGVVTARATGKRSRKLRSEVEVEVRGDPPRPQAVRIRGQVEGTPVTFLVDSGANTSVISKDVWERLPRTVRETSTEQEANVETVGGTTVAKGRVRCSITINGRTVVDSVLVMDVDMDGILGLSTMAALGCRVDLAGLNLLDSEGVETKKSDGERRAGPQVCHLTATKKVRVPARSEKMVPCALDGEVIMGDWLVGGDDPDDGLGLRVVRSVTCGNARKAQVHLVNLSDRAVDVGKGQVVTVAEEACVLGSQVEEAVLESSTPEVPDHLLSLFAETCTREKLGEEARMKLKLLLVKHRALFATSNSDLGRTTLVEHDIDTGDCLPIRQPARRPAITQQPLIEQHLKEMLEAGVISPAQSPWAAPVVLVKKKDGSVRFCVDYRRLNAVTRFDAYPLPRIDETFEALSGARYFCTLDLISGYWQVGLTERAKQRSAFITREGLFKWNVMPFGLCNAPSTFERLMETVLAGLQWKTCLVYLDDVIVFGATETEMLSRLDEVFSRLEEANLKLKPKKCRLFAKEVEYLGHKVSADGIAVCSDKVDAVMDWPVPTCAQAVMSFLGTASYYRRYVANFADIAAPLHRLTAKNSTWQWTEEEQFAFERLKHALATAPVLPFPVKGAPYLLDTDASANGIGGVLCQIVNGQERVLGYASKALNKHERNYCVTRRELLAVVKFVRHFRPYLHGQPFTVRTDHSSLQWLRSKKDAEGQLARWIEILDTFQFNIVHRPGKAHGNADGLSRTRCAQCTRDDCEEPRSARGRALPAGGQQRVCVLAIDTRWTVDEFRVAQETDAELRPLLAALAGNERPTPEVLSEWPPTARKCIAEWDRLEMESGVLGRRWYDAKGKPAQLQWLVPRSKVREVLETAHSSPLAGHFSDKRTKEAIKRQFWWPGMGVDVRLFCRACEVCARRKGRPTVAHHPQQRQTRTEPLQTVALDVMGPIDPPTEKGNRYILVITDYCTKWVVAVPLPNQTATTCAEAFVMRWVCDLGIPMQLHSDKGAAFEAKVFQKVCERLGIHKTHTTAYHPQSDGQTERANRTLEDVLAKLARDEPEQWDRWLPLACFAYNTSVHRVTKETPMRMMMGREARTPLSMLLPPPPCEPRQQEWLAELLEQFRGLHADVAEATRQAHRAEAPWRDRRQAGYLFEPGAKVWLYGPKIHPGRSSKLEANHWTGPWIIEKRVSDHVYKIKRDVTTQIVNVDRLRPYVDLDPARFPSEERADSSDSESTDSESSEADDEDARQSYNNGEEGGECDEEAGPEPLSDNHTPLTSRAQRARRTPRRLDDYDVSVM
jgi:transposase InsO family protein/predicted aspartyl protease